MDFPSAPAVNLHNGKFDDGDPATSRPPSLDRAVEQNAVFDEMINVIVAAGLAPDENDLTQLSTAITTLIASGAHAVVIKSASFEASVTDGEAVRWDNDNLRFDEATADGTANNRAVGIANVSDSEVVCFGETGLLSGMTPGARQYLSGAAAGGLVETAPDDVVHIGIAKSATVLFVDIDNQTGVLRSDQSKTVTAGYTATPKNLGNINSAKTLHISDGNMQHGVMTGDFTLTAPDDAAKGYIDLELTINGVGGHALTLVGFNEIDGVVDTSADVVNYLRITKHVSHTTLIVEQAVSS